jgi:tetratricopeptide (TPR) repeat protein
MDQSIDMKEELFIKPRETVPLDKEREEEYLKYYTMSPLISSKVSSLGDLCQVYIEAGAYDKAIAICEETIENPVFKDHLYDLWFKVGIINENKGDFKAALNAYLKSIEIDNDPGYWQHNNLAFCYLVHRQFEEARKHCQIAITINLDDRIARKYFCEQHYNAYKNIGVALEHMGDHFGALANYATAVKLTQKGESRCMGHLNWFIERYPEFVKKHWDVLDRMEKWCRGQWPQYDGLYFK